MILEQKWNFLFLALLVVGAVVVGMVYKSHTPICSDSNAKNCEKNLKIYNDYLAEHKNDPKGVATSTKSSSSDNDKEYSQRNYEKEFSCEYETANVWRTECLIENLDRASALREWKQKKLEALKHPEINTYEIWGVLSDSVAKIKKWRENFEDSRDEGCIAGNAFWGGSTAPGEVAECELNYEISALKTLDSLYYETIMGDYIPYSQGISNFEPTKEDIKKIMVSNKTERGCVWADDKACEDN